MIFVSQCIVILVKKKFNCSCTIFGLLEICVIKLLIVDNATSCLRLGSSKTVLTCQWKWFASVCVPTLHNFTEQICGERYLFLVNNQCKGNSIKNALIYQLENRLYCNFGCQKKKFLKYSTAP